MARAVTPSPQVAFTIIAWVIALLIFFPILWTLLTSPSRPKGEAVSVPPSFLFFHWTTENYAEVWDRSNYVRYFYNSVVISVGSTIIGLDHRHSGRLGHGLLADQAHQGRPDVDAVDEDAAGRRRARADLPDLQEHRPSRHPHRARHRHDADRPADHRLDAVHLFPRDPGRDPGSGPHGRRDARRRRSLRPDADGDARHRLDAASQHHPGLERGVLDAQPDRGQRRRR